VSRQQIGGPNQTALERGPFVPSATVCRMTPRACAPSANLAGCSGRRMLRPRQAGVPLRVG